MITDEAVIQEMASKAIEDNPKELGQFKEVSRSGKYLFLTHGRFAQSRGLTNGVRVC